MDGFSIINQTLDVRRHYTAVEGTPNVLQKSAHSEPGLCVFRIWKNAVRNSNAILYFG